MKDIQGIYIYMHISSKIYVFGTKGSFTAPEKWDEIWKSLF